MGEKTEQDQGQHDRIWDTEGEWHGANSSLFFDAGFGDRDVAGRYEIYVWMEISANDFDEFGFSYSIDSFWSDGMYQALSDSVNGFNRIYLARDV